MTTIRYGDVLPLVRRWALEQDASFDPWKPRRALQHDVPGAVLGNGRMSSPYCAIVLRVLNALTDEGTLVKTGTHRNIRYWQPAVRERHLARLAEDAEKAEAVLEEWRGIRARLTALGYGARPADGEAGVVMPLDHWRVILDSLEAAAEPDGPVWRDGYPAGP